MAVPAWLRGCRAAFVFLTRIPVGGFPYTPDAWRWSTAWFPFVGAVLGALMAAAWMGLAIGLGPMATATAVVGLGMMLTGGFHEDGVADTADAMGGAFDQDRLFEILKDSRVGAFGAMALFVVLLLRVSLLAELDEAAPWALILTQCAARTPPIWQMALIPYVTRDEASKSRLVTRGGAAQALTATLWPVLVGGGLVASGWATLGDAIAVAVAGIAVAAITAWRYRARAGGLTGDFLGATEQLSECAMLAALVWLRAM
ncbi:MAG: adenosylcobinamide-GDP ribazoletransferase [Myxococcota bacterium]